MEREVSLTVTHGSDSKKYENVSCVTCARQCWAGCTSYSACVCVYTLMCVTTLVTSVYVRKSAYLYLPLFNTFVPSSPLSPSPHFSTSHTFPSSPFSPLPPFLSPSLFLSSPPPPLQLAKVEKLKPTEVELKRLEDLAQSLVHDFAYMRAREEEMRDTNGLPLHPQLIPCTPPAQWCCIYATLALRTQHT